MKVPKYKDDDGNHLVWDYHTRDRLVIAWYLETEGDVGSILGEDTPGDSDQSRDAVEHRAVVDALMQFCEENGIVDRTEYGAPTFTSEKMAKKALKHIDIAMHARRQAQPMPEWAMKALDAGWKAPRGWKP